MHVLLLGVLSLQAQTNINIKISNPQPRVEDELTMTMEVDLMGDLLKSKLDKNIEIRRSYGLFSSKNITKTIAFTKEGTYSIGPFEFTFNGEKYTTNSVEVEVISKIPKEEGVWLRYIRHEGEQFIILEQLIANESDARQTENGFTQTIGGSLPEDDSFAEINLELTSGLTLYNSGSATRTIQKEGADFMAPGFSYSRKKYKVQYDDSFTGEYKFTSRNMKNLPKNVKIEEFVIAKE